MAVGISKKNTRFLNKTLCTHQTRLASGEGGKEERFLLPPFLKSLLDHGLRDSIFGKQTKAYLVAVKWNFESGHYNKFRNYSRRVTIHTQNAEVAVGTTVIISTNLEKNNFHR
jgi:hypothetical protein